jgi:hypothetical protein
MLMRPVGLSPEKAELYAQQNPKNTRQRGRPISENSQLSKNNKREKGKNWPRVPDGCQTPRQTGRLTGGRFVNNT